MPCNARDSTGTPRTGNAVFRRTHARQMRCATGTSDDHFQPALLRRGRVFEQQIRRAMRAHDARLERNAQSLERYRGVRHRLPIGLRPHDDADQRTRHCTGAKVFR